MKHLITFLFIVMYASSFAQSPLNVMTFNIRLNTASDSMNAWPFRRDHAASQILFYEVHLLGVQEALHDQMMDLQQRLTSYQSFGGGRDDGKTKGEYSAIFYDTARLQWLNGNMFWLSQTPEIPGSKGWDAAITRIMTWCKFRDKKTGKIFFAFNTHFDHIGKEARAASAKLVLQKVKQIAGAEQAIITGDFNATASDEPIKIITDISNPDHLLDTKQLSQTPHFGPDGTFTGFANKETGYEPIDHIFLNKKMTVLKHAALSETWQGRFSSDHFPVMAVIVL